MLFVDVSLSCLSSGARGMELDVMDAVRIAATLTWCALAVQQRRARQRAALLALLAAECESAANDGNGAKRKRKAGRNANKYAADEYKSSTWATMLNRDRDAFVDRSCAVDKGFEVQADRAQV